MATTEPEAAAVDAARVKPQGYAFGVDLVGSFPVPHVARALEEPAPRRVTIEPASAWEIDRQWRTDGVESLVDRRHPDGRPFMLIDQHEQLGFRIWAPHHGRYEVSPDGCSIRCAVPARTKRWERLFFAQTLPLAAALQRVELFHASAVALDGRAVAFVAPSGTGKTSVAAHLVDRGAELVTDDVLALEATDEGLTAHPGTSVLCLDEHELGRMQGSVGSVVGRSDKIHLSCRLVRQPLPLAAIYYLERSAAIASLTVRQAHGEPQLLLGSSFITYLRSPQYLLDHLELCAHAVRTVPTFKLLVPEGMEASSVASAVEAELR
jgi:hypothetical protein